MAMILILILTLSSAYSANESLDEHHSGLNFIRTLNDLSSRNISDDDIYDVDDSQSGSENGTAARNFWENWENHNRTYLESDAILPPVSTKQMAVTDVATVGTTSSQTDGFEMTVPTTVASEVTTYSLEDQVTKPVGDVWPVKLAAEVPGDLIIGGLMMVHEREDTITCGPIMPQGGIQAVETMLYTLDTVNKGLQPFTIGVHILDDCDKDTYGLEMAVDFIKGQ